ncbi:MAG: GNAT family N-acetyltransferase [Candidatus Thorarchaeota archaeon]
MPGFVIRSAVTGDAASISSLYSRVWSEYSDRFPKELLESRTPSPDEMVTWLHTDTYFVAETPKGIVGVVGCIFNHGTCYLTHMVVDSEHRRHGIGQALVDIVIETARKKNAMKVWLNTVPFLEEAITLYEKNGFKKCAFLRKHLWGLDVELFELVFD